MLTQTFRGQVADISHDDQELYLSIGNDVVIILSYERPVIEEFMGNITLGTRDCLEVECCITGVERVMHSTTYLTAYMHEIKYAFGALMSWQDVFKDDLDIHWCSNLIEELKQLDEYEFDPVLTILLNYDLPYPLSIKLTNKILTYIYRQ